MARKRGASNADRVALDITTVTATGAIVNSPCYVYSIEASLGTQTATGFFTIGQSTASADLLLESTKLYFLLGNGGTSAMSDRLMRNYFPPLFCNNLLAFASATNIGSVSVSYVSVG